MTCSYKSFYNLQVNDRHDLCSVCTTLNPNKHQAERVKVLKCFKVWSLRLKFEVGKKLMAFAMLHANLRLQLLGNSGKVMKKNNTSLADS